MPPKGIGRQELPIGKHGVCMKRGLEFAGHDWKDYNHLTEAEDTFYPVSTGTGRGIECIPVPEWASKDYEEMDVFPSFCRDRSVKRSGMDKTRGLPENDRMLYILIALILLAMLISSIIRAVCL